MDDILYGLIDKRREEGSDSDDLLDMLLEARTEDGEEGMEREQIRHEAMTIFIAGHETTAVAMGYTFFLLSGEAEVKNKLREEVRRVRPEGPIQFEDLNQLIYTKQVVEESLRLYPPAWIIGRRNIEPMQIDDFVIKTQTNILIPVFQLHRDERFWEEPDKFDPDRFRPEVRNQIDRFTYIPFGAGPRTCIGNHFALMEMQILLASIIRDFDFAVPEDYKLDLQPLITLRPKHPIPIKLKRL
jgi:cytochrome P450